MLNENLGASTEIESRMRINVPVQLNSDLVVAQNHALNRNTSTEFVQRIDGDAAKTITKEGFGNLQFAFTGALGSEEGFFGNLIINNGGVRLIVPNGAPAGTQNTVFSKAAGVTVMSGGQFQFGNTISAVALGPGAELKLNGPGKMAPATTTQNDGALRFENSADLEVVCTFDSPVNLQSDSHINVAAVDCTGILTQEVRGVGQLQKTGSGLLALSAANTYSGGTTISGGSLAVRNTSGSGVGTGDVAVNGGTLGGTGFIGAAGDPSNITLTGGVLAPGELTAKTVFNAPPSGLLTSPGILTAFGDVTFDSASSLAIDLNGVTLGTEYDQLAANGAITLGGATLNLSLTGFTPSGVESFTLISNTGGGGINGEFGNYAQGAEVDLGGVTYYMNYLGGSGNDVVLSPTPPALANANFDGDGDVDGADFLIWQRGLGGPGGLGEGDANGDGQVTAEDLEIWKSQFGTTGLATSAAGAVPEPAACWLALSALAAGCAGLRRPMRRG
jgi:autotransporter-associated beta strand protein